MMMIGGRHAASRPAIWEYSNPDWRSSDISRDHERRTLHLLLVWTKSCLQSGAIHDGPYPQNPSHASFSFRADLYRFFSENISMRSIPIGLFNPALLLNSESPIYTASACAASSTGTSAPLLSNLALKKVYDRTMLSILVINGSSTKSLSMKKNTGISTFPSALVNLDPMLTSSPAPSFCSSKQKH